MKKFFKIFKKNNFYKYSKYQKNLLKAKLFVRDFTNTNRSINSKFIYLYTVNNVNIELYHSFLFNVYKNEVYPYINRFNTKRYFYLIKISKKIATRFRRF